MATLIQRAGGDVEVDDVRFSGTGGLTMSGLLYTPSNATPSQPAPGVLAIHGYINSREMQSPYAIELARRGYVVLAIDQTGHGYSDPPAFANGFGGPDGLAFLRSLPIVDKEQVVLEGHSMGGWAALVAAGALPDGYRAIAISGSSTGSFGAPEGSATFPRNLGLVYARHDEFSGLMWGAPVARDIVETTKLKTLFGTEQSVEVGRLYGSIEAGTARKLFMPDHIHPANHITRAGIAPVLAWIQQTTEAPKPLPADDQIWYWKEVGTGLALLGAVLLLFSLGRLLLTLPAFAPLQGAPPEPRGASGTAFWVAALLTLLLPALLYIPVQQYAEKIIAPSALWPQNITTQLVCWAWATGLVSLALFSVWHFTSGKRRGATARHYGLVSGGAGRTGRDIGRDFLLALAVVAGPYAAVLVSDVLFKTDFRLWVVAAKPLSGLQALIVLPYLLPFTAFFLLLGVVLHGQLRSPEGAPSLPRALARNAVLTGGGFVLLLLIQYVPLLSGGTLTFPDAHLVTIVALQLVLVLPIVGMISTYYFHKTGRVYAGAFVNGLFVTWLLVGGQAIHHPF